MASYSSAATGQHCLAVGCTDRRLKDAAAQRIIFNIALPSIWVDEVLRFLHIQGVPLVTGPVLASACARRQRVPDSGASSF